MPKHKTSTCNIFITTHWHSSKNNCVVTQRNNWNAIHPWNFWHVCFFLFQILFWGYRLPALASSPHNIIMKVSSQKCPIDTLALATSATESSQPLKLNSPASFEMFVKLLPCSLIARVPDIPEHQMESLSLPRIPL